MAKWGLRNLAPLLGGYRLLDGGYTEQTGVAFTLATMQRDARPGEPLKIIVVNNDACYPDAGNEVRWEPAGFFHTPTCSHLHPLNGGARGVAVQASTHQ